MNYRSEIDGLRALAVIPVILFHAGFNAFSGGFVGVDIFFVISGYLITTILLDDIQSGNFSLARFYERRARRILPALFFVVLVTIPFAWVLLPLDQLISFSKSVGAVAMFISNIFFRRDGGYFETVAELKPLLHTWSLAVEEQFYIVFPLFILAFWRFGKRCVFWAVVLTAIISLTIAQIGSSSKPVPNFFLIPSRAWELAIGALAALFLFDKGCIQVGRKARQLISCCGIAFVLIAIFLFGKSTPYPSVYALLPTVGTVLIILFADKETYVGKLLSTSVFVWIGLISYSAYLWHQPVFAFARVAEPSFGEIPRLALFALILCLSFISWKLIETPFRSGNLFGRKFVFAGAITVSVTFVLFGYWSSRALIAVDREVDMARELVKHEAIYASNMNERKFIKSRIEFETILPKIIVLGSSRIMQVGRPTVGAELLNLAVSGSSIEDVVAIWKLASQKFDPDLVLISADPWLFNAASGQRRWRSLETEYYSALSDLNIELEMTKSLEKVKGGIGDNVFAKIYRHVNVSVIAALDDSPEVMDKIRRDGSRVYNLSYANRTNHEIETGALRYVKYAMSPYKHSPIAVEIFERLLHRIHSSRKVVLVLSPYHPKLYQFMASENPQFIQIEQQFRDLSAKLNVPIIGSYDPDKVGCDRSDFYDGMHPKDSCMARVLADVGYHTRLRGMP